MQNKVRYLSIKSQTTYAKKKATTSFGPPIMYTRLPLQMEPETFSTLATPSRCSN